MPQGCQRPGTGACAPTRVLRHSSSTTAGTLAPIAAIDAPGPGTLGHASAPSSMGQAADPRGARTHDHTQLQYKCTCRDNFGTTAATSDLVPPIDAQYPKTYVTNKIETYGG